MNSIDHLAISNGARILAVMGYDSCFGAERANVYVLGTLLAMKAQVRCLVRYEGSEKFLDLLSDKGISAEPVRFGPGLFGLQRNPLRYWANVKGMLHVSKALLRITRKWESTHIYIPNYIQFLYAWPALKLLRRPTIFRIGDPPETTRLHRQMWGRIIAPCVRTFVANSEFTRRRLLTAVGKTVDCRVIRNCPTRESEILQTSMRQKRAGVLVSYVGQINASKGVHVAVAAAIKLCKECSDLKFQFVGMAEGSGHYVSGLIAQVQSLGLESRISFLPYVSDVQPIFADSDVHICPSLQEESSANVVIEAKQAGIPSVVFPKGGLPELVGHKVDGFICEGCDADSLADGIRFFLTSRERLIAAGGAARASLSRHSPQLIRRLWADVFGISPQFVES